MFCIERRRDESPRAAVSIVEMRIMTPRQNIIATTRVPELSYKNKMNVFINTVNSISEDFMKSVCWNHTCVYVQD